MDVRPIDAHVAEIKLIEILASAMAKRKTVYDASDDLIEVVRSKSPTLDYAPVRHGEWVEEIEPNVVTASGRDVHLWRCSSCGFTWANKHDVMNYYKHCPNCGAKMDGGKDHV